MHRVWRPERDTLSILLLHGNVSGLGPLPSLTVLTCIAGFIARRSSQEMASSFGEVGAEARSGLGRWGSWLLKWPMWNVWAGCQAKRKVLILALRLSSSLLQLVMSGRKETNMKHFFKGKAYPSHEFILSSGFSRKKGAKVQPVSLRTKRVFCRPRFFLFSGACCRTASRVIGLQMIRTATRHKESAKIYLFVFNPLKWGTLFVYWIWWSTSNETNDSPELCLSMPQYAYFLEDTIWCFWLRHLFTLHMQAVF